MEKLFVSHPIHGRRTTWRYSSADAITGYRLSTEGELINRLRSEGWTIINGPIPDGAVVVQTSGSSASPYDQWGVNQNAKADTVGFCIKGLYYSKKGSTIYEIRDYVVESEDYTNFEIECKHVLYAG